MEVRTNMLQLEEKVLDRCFTSSYVHDYEPKKVKDLAIFKERR